MINSLQPQGENWHSAAMLHPAILFPAAAILEIAGCFAVWAWWRLGASPLWLLRLGGACCFRFSAGAVAGGCCGPELRGLWRCLYRRLSALALGGGAHAAGSLRPRWRGGLPCGGSHHSLRAAQLIGGSHDNAHRRAADCCQLAKQGVEHVFCVPGKAIWLCSMHCMMRPSPSRSAARRGASR